MIKRELIERMVQGVLRVRPDTPQQRLRMELDAAFPQLSNGVAEAFAESADRRSILRVVLNLVFVAGTATLPATPLKKYLNDASLIITDTPMDYREPYADFRQAFETRIGTWAVNATTIYAKTPQGGVLSDYDGAAQFACIAQPPIPGPDDQYLSITGGALDDVEPQLIDAGISFMLGAMERSASESA